MNKMKKIVILIISVLLIIVLATVGIVLFDNSKRKYEIEEIKEFKYFTFIQNDMTGVIDTEGNVLVDAKYDLVKIPNPSKAVFVCVYNYDINTGEGDSIIVNDKNEEILNDFEEVSEIQLERIITNVPYEKSILRFKQDNKYGIIDFEGNIIVKAIYDEISSMQNKEGELLVKQNDKYGIINMKGHKLLDIKYDEIENDNYYTRELGYKQSGYIVGIRTDEGLRYGYINNNGKVVLKSEYNKVSRITEKEDNKNIYLLAEKSGKVGFLKNSKVILDYEYQDIEYDAFNNVLIVEKNKVFGLMDLEKNIKIPIIYDKLTIQGTYICANKDSKETIFDVEGNKQEKIKYRNIISTSNEDYFITIDNNNQYGVQNKKGQVLISNNYYYIEYLYGQYFIVSGNNSKSGIINSSNKILLDIKYDVVQRVEDSNMVITIVAENNTIGLYDNNINELISIPNSKKYDDEDYIKIYSDKEVKYFGLDGKEKTNIEIFSNNKFFAKEQNGKWGFVDKEGNMKIDFIYDQVTEFNKNGFAGINKNGKWGSINEQLEILQEPIYTFDSRYAEPNFIGKYYKMVTSFGESYYTDEIMKQQ